MNAREEKRIAGWRFLVPFLIGDVLLLAAAVTIYLQAARPMSPVETATFALCVTGGALLGVWPLVLRNRADLKRYEIDELSRTLAQIQRSEEVARCIENATAHWQTAQEHAVSTVTAAREIGERMENVQKEFRSLADQAADAERNHLRLEVNPLRRAESDWLQVLVRVLDHVHALHMAGVRSGQAGLIEQLGNFQNACRDAARRVGLVPVLATPGAPFNAELNQLVNPEATVPDGAVIGEMMATGFAYQGQLLRRAVVTLQSPTASSTPTESVLESFSSLPKPATQQLPGIPEVTITTAGETVDNPDRVEPQTKVRPVDPADQSRPLDAPAE